MQYDNVFAIRLEIENARLEATASKQSKEIDALQKGTQEAAMVSDAKSVIGPE